MRVSIKQKTETARSAMIDAAQVRKAGAKMFVKFCQSPAEIIQQTMDDVQIERD